MHTHVVHAPVAEAGWRGNSSACVQGDGAARPEGGISTVVERASRFFKIGANLMHHRRGVAEYAVVQHSDMGHGSCAHGKLAA
jgi:hypothetical protein